MRRTTIAACMFSALTTLVVGCGTDAPLDVANDGTIAETSSELHFTRVPKARVKKLHQTGDSLSARSGHQIVAVRNSLYVIRGIEDDFASETNTFRHDVVQLTPTILNRIHVNDLVQRGNQQPGDLSQHCSVVDPRHGGDIISFGGSTYKFLTDPDFFASLTMFDTTWTYRVLTRKWTLAAPTTKPSPRAGCHAEFHNGSMYMFGGLSRFFALNNEMWKFNPDSEVWTQIPPSGTVPSPRYLGATVLDGNKMYLFSGHQFTPTGEASIGDFWVYDIPTNRWTQLPSAPLPSRDEGTLSVLRTPHGKKYIVNTQGHTRAPQPCVGVPLQTTGLKDILAYDPDTQTWQNLEIIGPQPRVQFIRGATIDNVHYLAGGWEDVPDPVNVCRQVWNDEMYQLTLDD